MSLRRAMSQRKATSIFINDSIDANLMQFSPQNAPCHLERNSGYAVQPTHDSRTNFIGDSNLIPDRPRAFYVTKTGEKQLLNLDNNSIPKTSSNPFTINSPRFSAPAMERISEKSSSQSSLTQKTNKSSSKLLKKSKLKRYPNQKLRLVFSPRNLEKTLATPKAPATDQTPPRLSKYKAISRIHSTETQTECQEASFATGLYLPKQDKKFKAAAVSMDYIPMEGSRTYSKESMQRKQGLYVRETLPTLKPLKIYTKSNYNLKKYSELRSLASAVTLITVVSWLFSTFFDVQCVWNYLDSLVQHVHDWFIKKEKPKTKVEIFLKFLQEFWS